MLCCFVIAASCGGQETRMTPELLWQLGRLGNSTVSADGQQVAYTVRRYDLAENAGTSSIYVRDLESGSQRELLSKWSSLADLQFALVVEADRIRATTHDEIKAADAVVRAPIVDLWLLITGRDLWSEFDVMGDVAAFTTLKRAFARAHVPKRP